MRDGGAFQACDGGDSAGNARGEQSQQSWCVNS